MCKLLKNYLGIALSRTGGMKLGAVVSIGLMAATAWAQTPANDNFSNAGGITGAVGTTNGSNVRATSEPGEPPIPDGGGKTIWYKWTAPFNGSMVFSTEGSDFDTTMAVFTGNKVTNLTQIAANDDANFPVDVTSRVNVSVTNGGVYYIAIDGFQGATGDVTLSWQPSGAMAAGNFLIAQPAVPNVPNGGIPFSATGTASYLISHQDTAGLPAARVRVTRTAGAAGRVFVSYVVTNTLYTNIFRTNMFGSNILSTNFSSNMSMTLSFSNVFTTNFFISNSFQNFDPKNGFFFCDQVSGIQLPPGIQVGTTNFGTNASGSGGTTNSGMNTSVMITNAQNPCLNISMPPGTTTNADGTLTVAITNIFCTNVVVTNIVPSAMPNQDYIPATGTLVFNDYEMGKDLPLNILSGQLEAGAALQIPQALLNHLVVVNLTNATLDPLEETDLALPAIDPGGGKAVVTLLNLNVPAASLCTTTDSIVNLGQSLYWSVDNNQVAISNGVFVTNGVLAVNVVRTGTNLAQACSVTLNVGQQPPGSPGGDTFALQPGSDYANPNPPASVPRSSQPPDFLVASIPVNFGPNVTTVAVTLTNFQNNVVKFNEDYRLALVNPQSCSVGQVGTATVTILFDTQPAGAIDRDHNPNDVPFTTPPFNHSPGANNTVYAAAVQPIDGKTVFAGDFTAYNTVTRNRIARMNTDGSLDTGFLASPNSGADGVITCLAVQSDSKIVIGGAFGAFNGTNRHAIARINPDGSLDQTFNPGVGANGTVWSLQLQSDGKIVIAGNFTLVNSTNRNSIARLNVDGSLDTTFDPGIGPNNTINAVALQNGKIVIGGDFTTVDNTNYNHLARLNADGTLDPTFNIGAGADNNVFAITTQANGNLLVGGAFSTINLISRNSIARLNADGSLDASFDPGSGADDVVYAITLQPDGNILIGGIFASYNSTRRIGLARLFSNGLLDTSFMDTAYNQFAGLVRPYFSQVPSPKNFLFAIALQSDGNVIIGGSFNELGGGTDTDRGVFSRNGLTPRLNIARLIGGSTPGPGNIGLANNSYSADKFGSQAYVTLVRNNGALGPASVTFAPTPQPAGPGAAVPGTDYGAATINPVWTSTWLFGATWDFADCFTGPNNNGVDDLTPHAIQGDFGTADVLVNILNNPASTGDLLLNVGVSQPQSSDIFFLGGENIPLGVALDKITTGTLAIVDNTLAHGTFGFSSATFAVNENATNAIITVVRTNGSAGLVSLQYATTNGGTALPKTDYGPVTGTLTFGTGQTNASFTVPVVNGFTIAPDKTVNLALFNINGGGTLGLASAVLTIINDNFQPGHLNFSSSNFTAHETAGSTAVTVTRTGGSSGAISVSYATADGTAINGINYGSVSNTLSWNSGDVAPKTFAIPLIHDSLVTSNKTANLSIFNPVINGVTNNQALGPQSNATLTIINDDFFGSPTFSTAAYTVNKNGGFATITVNRLGGSAQTINVSYSTADGTAFAGLGDYGSTSGTLTFNPGQISQSFTVPIHDNLIPTGNTFFTVQLFNATPAGVTLGNPSTATVTIIDTDSFNEPPGSVDTTLNSATGFNDAVYALALQTDGKILAGGDFTVANGIARNRIARLLANGVLDLKFSSATDGTENSVRTLAIQSDGRILIGGLFTNLNGINRSYFGRLNFDGSVDETFDPGAGADNPVYAIAESFVGPATNSGNRRIVIGGSFASVNGTPLNGIARLNNDGSVDFTFNPVGANATVYALAVYSTNDANSGKILVGGDFTQVNGIPRNHIARLNADGSLDTSFNPGAGPNDSVRAIAIQVDGKVLIGGLFTTVGGAGLNRIARLNGNGQVDPLFNPGVGANDVVSALAIQEDGKIMVGGGFTQANGITRNRLTRLNVDGTADPSINFGSGADGFVSAVVIQPDDELVIGGGFTQFGGVSRPHIARLYGRSEIGAGSFQFTSAGYQVNESATNIVIGVQRVGGTAGAVGVLFSTSDGSAVSGVNYIGVTNTLLFPVGETFQSVSIPVIGNTIVDINRTVNLALSNPTGGATLGVQPTALVTIINTNSAISFSATNYTVIKNAVNGAGIITLVRSGSSIGPASVDFATTTTGTAVAGQDYTPTSNTVLFADGQTSQQVTVPVINNGLVEGNQTVGLILSNPTNTFLAAPNAATLTIIDNNLAPGNLMFAATGFSVSETGTNAVITVVRTNGSIGQISVNFAANGGTATVNTDYTPVSGSLTFFDGETNKTFLVPVFHDPVATGNLTVNLTLTNPTGGAQIIGPATVPLTILDVDTGVGFDLPGYFVNDTNGTVTIGVRRATGTNVSVSVQYATTNSTALAGTDYTAASGTLNFAIGETFKTFNVQILRNAQITGNRIFFINLSGASGNAQIVNPGTTAVTVVDTDTGLSFVFPTNSVGKADGSISIPVLRTGSVVGPVSVNFNTSDGTAAAGIKYVATNGVLNFPDGVASNAFSVFIINDNQVDGDQTFNVSLVNPSGSAQLLSPSNEVVTIVDNTSGFSFSSPTYSVAENGVAATITVSRTGTVTTTNNGTVSVSFATSDGTAHAGVHYVSTNGTLIFTNGQTSATFSVQLIDANIIGGSDTVNLTLSNPSSTTVLLNPNAATLTILNNDGSIIVPAGSALTTESGPVNGAIDPGETVTLLLALRDSGGANTTNLMATLQASNGVTAPSPATAVSYGVLVTDGPSVSRPFAFKAQGTNGSVINAVLQLQDGAKNLGTVSFNYTLGTVTNSFTNNALIFINDDAPATPYPSTINVSSVNGTIGKVTATVSNLSHGNISDVSVLLVGPTSQSDLLMAKVGGSHVVQNQTFTFDDNAAASLTTNMPFSGTYKPTQFATDIPFPASTNGPGLLPGPFGTQLSDFIGSNPNGVWSLYVFDDTALDNGTISNGWILNISSLSVVAPTVDLAVGLTTSTNAAVVFSNLTYFITVTNAGPSAATGIEITTVLPPGVTLVSSNASQGGWSSSDGVTLVCSIGALAKDGTANASLVVTPTVLGLITNTITASANEAEANFDDNTASVITSVNTPTADLAIGVVNSPNPVGIGTTVTYAIAVTNLGPATATNVVVTDVLPAGLTFQSVSPPGVFTNAGGTISYNMGILGSGASGGFSILVTATIPGTITNTLNVSSSITDPLKANNKATSKLVVQGVQLSFSQSSSSLVFAWPSSASSYTLQSSPTLSPATWTNVTNPVPQLVSGQYTVTIPISPGTLFFRLIAPTP